MSEQIGKNYAGFIANDTHDGVTRKIFAGKAADGDVCITIKTHWPGAEEPAITELGMSLRGAGMLASCLVKLLHKYPNAQPDEAPGEEGGGS